MQQDAHETRARIAELVAERGGVATVARLLGVSRAGLTSYLAGRAQRGTDLLVETGYQRHVERSAA
jgi:predicted transcriptional regulator